VASTTPVAAVKALLAQVSGDGSRTATRLTTLGGLSPATRHTRCGHHSDPADLLPGELSLADVKPGPHLEAELPYGLDDLGSASHPRRRARERREETVPCCIDLVATVPLQLSANRGMMPRLDPFHLPSPS